MGEMEILEADIVWQVLCTADLGGDSFEGLSPYMSVSAKGFRGGPSICEAHIWGPILIIHLCDRVKPRLMAKSGSKNFF